MQKLDRRSMLGSLVAGVGALLTCLWPKAATASAVPFEKAKLTTAPFPSPFLDAKPWVLSSNRSLGLATASTDPMQDLANKIREFGEAADKLGDQQKEPRLGVWVLGFSQPSMPVDAVDLPCPDLSMLWNLRNTYALSELVLRLLELPAEYVLVANAAEMGQLPRKPAKPEERPKWLGERTTASAFIDADLLSRTNHRTLAWAIWRLAKQLSTLRLEAETACKESLQSVPGSETWVSVYRCTRPEVFIRHDAAAKFWLDVSWMFGGFSYSAEVYASHTWPVPTYRPTGTWLPMDYCLPYRGLPGVKS